VSDAHQLCLGLLINRHDWILALRRTCPLR
jgi:hypothetical protein